MICCYDGNDKEEFGNFRIYQISRFGVIEVIVGGNKIGVVWHPYNYDWVHYILNLA